MPPAAPGLSPAAKLAWLRLIRTENIGPVTFRQLLNRAGSAEAAIEQLPRLLKRAGASARVPSLTEADDEVAALARLGGRFVASADPDYPPLLTHIWGAPPLVAVLGTGAAVNLQRTAAIVGARNASAAGKRMSELLSRGLGEAGFTVVSGLARGIDAAAHKAALPTGTVALLAGGADKIYPEENEPLARAIVEAGGLLIAEMPLGWQARARDFPRRNRLVSGLSLGVVVVEAARQSGSLITARLALEQNRDVFAVPGSPLDQRSEGANHLIQQGARLVTSAADIVEALAMADPARASLLEPNWDGGLAAPLGDTEPSGDDRARLIEALSPTPMPVDALIAATGLSVGIVQSLLLELDLAGRIEWSAGQLVALKP
jgi:DNA processing protein